MRWSVLWQVGAQGRWHDLWPMLAAFYYVADSTNLRREKAPWQLGPVDAKADAAVQKRRTLVDKKQMGTGYRSFWEKG